mgnify:CR=1 FL=1
MKALVLAPSSIGLQPWKFVVVTDAAVKTQLAGLASYETPKKIALLEHDFSVERGELTPTLKVKRRVIDKTYKPLIDGLYEE